MIGVAGLGKSGISAANLLLKNSVDLLLVGDNMPAVAIKNLIKIRF